MFRYSKPTSPIFRLDIFYSLAFAKHYSSQISIPKNGVCVCVCLSPHTTHYSERMLLLLLPVCQITSRQSRRTCSRMKSPTSQTLVLAFHSSFFDKISNIPLKRFVYRDAQVLVCVCVCVGESQMYRMCLGEFVISRNLASFKLLPFACVYFMSLFLCYFL